MDATKVPHWVDGRFVFVTVPAAYKAVERFYIDVRRQEERDFVLQPRDFGAETELCFAQISDMHISTERRAFAHHLEEDLDQINREVGERLQFVVASGDLTAGGKAEEYRAYLRAVATAPWPVYHAAGNHDDDEEVEGLNFMDHLGPLYYSFDWGPVHFVVYDGEFHGRGGASAERAFAYVPSLQDGWLRADLAAQPAGRPVIAVNHFPWGDEMYGQWRDFSIIATLSGHWHSCRLFKAGNTAHYNIPSLGFAGIDHSPRAYRVFSYAQGVLRAETRALGYPEVFSGVSFRPHPQNEAGLVRRFGGRLPQAQTPWPLVGGNSRRTGCALRGPRPPLQLAWKAGDGRSDPQSFARHRAGAGFPGAQKRRRRRRQWHRGAGCPQRGALLVFCDIGSGEKRGRF